MASSPPGLFDTEPPSSPAHYGAIRSFATSGTANLTDDDDNDRDLDHDHADGYENGNGTTRHTSHGTDTPSRDLYDHGTGGSISGGRSGRSRGGGRDSMASTGGGGSGGGSTGLGAPGLFKDPSAIGKIRHLKKEDGEPLWRVDIQYDFLRAIFDDQHQVFTNNYEPDKIGKQCFADLYIDTMARSSKTSKILHDKLLSDRNAAINMAMVCLLVNIGRMNTTLNFFPEMRAQLRTYHAIPSLQVNERITDYKQLQDAPRLKSILKGGTEDRNEPRSLEALKEMDPPRTNPVNLLFLICNNASKVAELHFPPGREFHDLIMKTNLTSQSRATAFLWIMWFYLESDFTEEGCEENPFGAGVDYGVDVANQGVPALVRMTPEEEAEENQDTPAEREFGYIKRSLRAKILSDDKFIEMPPHKRNTRPSRPSAAASVSAVAAGKEGTVSETPDAATDNERPAHPAILPRIRPSKHESDVESMRSTPPPRSLIRSFGGGPGHGGPGSGAGTKRSGPLKHQAVDGSSPVRQPPLLQQLHLQLQHQAQPPSRAKKTQRSERGRYYFLHDDDDDDGGANNTSTAPGRKTRPPTAHQIAVENNRKQRIEYLLSRGMYRKHHRARKVRRTEGAIVRALRRLDEVSDPFLDSEDEDSQAFNRGLFNAQPGAPQNMPTGTAFRERGFYGLVQLSSEPDDFGEELSNYAAAVRRACRRINRWETDGKNNHAVVPTIKRPRVNVPPEDEFKDPNETEEEQDNMDQLDADVSMAMSVLETTPVPPAAKRRRTAGTPSGRARGGRAGKAAGAAAGGGAGSSSNRRRRPAAAKANHAANGDDVTMVDADAGGKLDGAVLASGAEGEGEGEADGDVDANDVGDIEAGSAAATSAAADAKPRVAAKKSAGGGGASSSSRAAKAAATRRAKVKREEEEEEEEEEEDDDDDDEAEAAGAGAGGEDEDEGENDELNDMDKTLLGMGDGDSDSDSD